MTNEERDLITGLFNRLRSADNPQKDREAEQLIQQSTGAQPSAPYLLVQTVLVQEHALSNAQARIQQLEKALAEAKPAQAEGGVGGFLSGLFGGHSTTPAPASQSGQARPQPPPVPQQQPPAQGYVQQGYPQQPGYAQPAPPYPSTVNMPPSAGGGFLKGALGTAAGVAGGALLFQGIENLLGHNSGAFGGGGFGHSGGFFGGGGGYGGGFGSGQEIIENREVINNYYDERGNQDQGGGGNSSFLGGGSNEEVGFHPATQQEDNRYDSGNSGDTDGNGPLYSTPPTDDPVSNSGDTDGNGPLYSTPPTDDADSGMVDNSYDSGNTDSGGDSSGGSDDSSYV